MAAPPRTRAVCAALLAGAVASAQSCGPTFGTGLAGFGVCASPTVVLNYTLAAGATHAALHHFWVTGDALKVDRMLVEYFVDGEATPSVAFQPSMMCGLAFPAEVAHDFEFSAGGLCGKTAPVGGWSNVFPVPFYASVVVTVRAYPLDAASCFTAYLNIRGTVGWPLALPSSGVPLPLGTRLRTQTNALALRQPLEFVTVAALAAGTSGILFQTSWAVEAQPVGGPAAGGGYIEGCWNFFSSAAESYPGLVVGTGVEDYFDSGYYFGADSGDAVGVLFANALSGLTLFQREAPFERLSAYRFHGTDPLVMVDGGSLTWQVGCGPHPGASKCGNVLPPALGVVARAGAGAARVSRELSAVNVTTSAWIYVLPPRA